MQRRTSSPAPSPSLVKRATSLRGDPEWYKDAVIYELRVRSFYDGDGDGIGDFRGLIERLPYLEDLGVTALWLLPFYPSPLRDDGYDISDYTTVHPECGTLDDFQRFLDAAHRRNLRVITELVLNHTSDQHPWFQRARRAEKGSVERDFYLWSDTPERFRDARIIFSDYEPSNWSWDPLARAYYWHRFYSHQPDLNYDNPAVRAAMLEVLDLWLAMGVDGLRLDAVPYLFEREGTTCENLPETHAFLRELRAHIDARWEGRMLLAEANQWPEDAVAYFGEGDECHMAFHFPLMPRIFVSIILEDRFPIADILAEMPRIPPSCQWALFLRNHDELTLEMVTDEERDAMYKAYASEPAMRLNLGIRRRLAPLAGNDRRRIELMNALLFSLPGTPVVYYGDEIGMGDNVYLGDRNGVRTPMQWSADKNAGFSRANPQRLILPVIIDPEYHYEALNVEAQQASAGSLLWWTKRLIAQRGRHRAFGRGTLELLRPDNPRVFAFVRRFEDETILVVANLSRLVQFVEIDLTVWKGLIPVELFGGSALPAIGDAPVPLTLAGHGFYWFALVDPGKDGARAAAYEPPLLETAGAGGDPLETALAEGRGEAIAEVLAAWAAAQPWFRGRGRRIERAAIVEVVAIGDPPEGRVTLLELGYEGGGTERYHVSLAFAAGDRAGEIRARSPQAVIASLRSLDESDGGGGVLFDALADLPSARALVEAMFARGRVRGRGGVLTAEASPALHAAKTEETPVPASLPASAIFLFGARFSLDVTRRLDDGASPGLELARFLAGRDAPLLPLAGAVELTAPRREPVALLVVRAFLPGESDAMAHAAGEILRFFERVLARPHDAPEPPARPMDLLRLSQEEPPAEERDAIGSYLDAARLLGRRTAELHVALAAGASPAFAPEPYSPFDQRGAYQTLRTLAGRTLRELAGARRSLPADAAPIAARLVGREDEIMRRFGVLLGRRLGAPRTRHHGALDLSRVVYTGHDFVFADLEGDRDKPLAERRRKGSPLRDVAALVRSLHDAVFSVLLDPERVRPGDVGRARAWASAFWLWSSAALVGGYLATAEPGGIVPRGRDELSALFDAFLFESGLSALSRALAESARSPRVEIALAFLDALFEAPRPAEPPAQP
jgi:maltose alpha-D-glucosyltransferase/alpha-amylase